MKYLDEFRAPAAAMALGKAIAERAGDRPMALMEVCGTHTMAIFRHGLRALLPKNVRLVSGPGCPVCVTPNGYLDRAIALGRLPEVTITTFGDMIRVPGSWSSLERERAEGRDIRIVYSPRDALALAKANPERRVVFLGIGFETTAPTVAAAILEASREGVANFSVLASHKVMPPPMRALVDSQELEIDGFLCPGHVSAIIGAEPYRFLAEEYGVPCVIGGFEPTDILQSILMLVEQVAAGVAKVEIQYTRVVRPEGNPAARRVLEQILEPADAEWRGIGAIPGSGLAIRPEYAGHDAEKLFDVQLDPPREHPGCRCGAVLRGAIEPPECPLFRMVCTPENPLGACMVSSEGTCSAFYKYGEGGGS